MNWTEYVASVSAASVLVGGVVGAWAKAWVDGKISDRKDNLDQLQLALSQIARQDAKIDLMGGQISNLGKRIEELLVANTRLESANESLTASNRALRHDITSLQAQITGLGHTPVMPDDVAPTYVCDPSCPLAQSKATRAINCVARESKS